MNEEQKTPDATYFLGLDIAQMHMQIASLRAELAAVHRKIADYAAQVPAEKTVQNSQG